MPYRLRRVIGINIRNPRDEGPSLRLAELDTRGAVIAAGRNGVGKTSFLRLIPLFYGATPTRILRGSGLTTMIRYMLPHPSSAVAYEYERENGEDLRCVVMHCRPDEDAPQFHILRGGFEERFFYDENDTFVSREAFKARVEGFGVVVEQKLTLAEYRSVILNEKSSSKQASVMRHLAVAHSLAPVGTSLQGLDHIAAAMGNEKISFRDLQDIVVERITSSISEEGSRNAVRQIRKSATTVSSWLLALQHLRDLKGRQADAEKLFAGCRSVQKTGTYLRELRSSVRQLAAETRIEVLDLVAGRKLAEAQGTELAEELSRELESSKGKRDEAKTAARTAKEKVEATEARRGHFLSIDVHALVAEAQQEGLMLARQREVGLKLIELKNLALGIEQSYEAKVGALSQLVRDESQRLIKERSDIQDEERRSREALVEQQGKALAALVKPQRLNFLPGEIGKQQVLRGELTASLRNPALPPKLVLDLERIEKELMQSRQGERQTKKAMATAEEEARKASQAQQTALVEHQQTENRMRALKDERARLENDLRPPSGSLQEFLRSSANDSASDVAKVISSAIAKRIDLNPLEVPDGPAVMDGIVAIGPFAIQVGTIDVPDWFDERDIQRQLQGISKQVEASEGAYAAAIRKLDAANIAYTGADQALTLTTAAHGNTSAAVDALEKRELEVRSAQRDAREVEFQRVKVALEEAEVLLNELEQELSSVHQEHESSQHVIRESFTLQQGDLRNRTLEAIERVDGELKALTAKEEEQQTSLKEERDTGFTRAGIKPEDITSRESELKKLAERLRRVGDYRHEVEGWKVFLRGSLATLESDVQQEHLLAKEFAKAHAASLQAEKILEGHVSEVRRTLSRFDVDINLKTKDAQTLEDMLVNQLATILDAASTRVVRSWIVDDLLTETHKQLRELDLGCNQVDTLYHALRAVMRRSESMVSDWLSQAEDSLPDMTGYPDYEVKRLKGENICRWFQSDFASAVNALQQELTSILGLAGSFVRDMEVFNRQVTSFNGGLQKALRSVTGFDNFRDLEVQVRSGINKLEYLDTLERMHDMSASRVSLLRGGGPIARDIELPEPEIEPLIRSFRDLLQREGGISVNLADQIRLECSLTINKSRIVISSEDEFRARASNGNSALIVAMFLMGFAQMIRKEAPVRITWVTDEIGRFDSGNVNAFLETLNANHIDVISAAPQADPSMLYLFDRHCVFRKDGSIWEHAEGEVSYAA